MLGRCLVLITCLAGGLGALVIARAPPGGTPAGGDEAAAAGAGVPASDWELVWADEFEGDGVDRRKWTCDLGNRLPGGQGGWGNRELQSYTDRPGNVFVRDGMLHIRAVREAHDGVSFTSARLKTKGLFSKTYGRFEVRAKLPLGKGVWPAVWMLPEENQYGGWSASGEIDLVEARGQEPTKVLGTLHYGAPAPGNTHAGAEYVLPDGGTIADFHQYALEWEPGEIRWSVDGRQYQARRDWWSGRRRRRGAARPPTPDAAADDAARNPWPAPFDQPFHLLLNVAVGGNFPGNPDPDTAFPVEMEVDYVRVYDRKAGYEAAKLRSVKPQVDTVEPR